MNCYFDERWIGPHGIGRVAARLAARIPFLPLGLQGKPSQPQDPLRLALALRQRPDADLFFSPGFNAPLFGRTPYVLCVHDLCPLDNPESKSLAKSLYFQTVTRYLCHRARFVLTVSEFSRTRILDWSGLPESQVIAVPNGVDPEYQPEGPAFTHPAPYLLCVSNRRPNKNEFRTLEGFARAKGLDSLPILLTGSPTSEISAHIQKLGISERVHFIGRITDAELPALYRSALGVVFVSLYEGFGLPVVEAMASGTPVLTSSTTSLPEVSGDAALLVDPCSVSEIAHGIEQLLTDDSLRATLRKRGLERAKAFSWDTSASRVREVLHQAAGCRATM